MASPVKVYKDIPKPAAFEEYEFEVANLSNGLNVLLVSSPKIDMAGCAVGVGVGALDDPRGFQGLAHFCEHMLFMGTDKYPNEDEFNDFVSRGGGVSNAFTTDRETVYYAKVKPDFLDGLVDRVTQFFAAPKFNASAVDREVEAVNSEFEKNLQDDSRRKYDLWKSLANPRHPLHTFNTGNNKTLRRLDQYGKKEAHKSLEDLRNALIEFHTKHYSANIMAGVILGNQPLRHLRDMCYPRLAAIPNKTVNVQMGSQFGRPELPFSAKELQRQIKIVPVREAEKTVDFRFMIRDQYDCWRSKPGSFLSHCIGHEGPGSLLAYLKAAGLATGLYAGTYMDNIGESPFTVNVSATDKGITAEGMAEIGEALFVYLRMLRETGIPKWAVEEEQALARLRWKFRPMPSVEELMREAAQTMLQLPPELVFEAGYVSYECKPEEILDILKSDLVIEKLNLLISARAFEKECKTVEPIYGTKYNCAPLDSNWVKRWKAVDAMPAAEFGERVKKMKLRFLEKNLFIPQKLDMKKGAAKPEAFPERLAKTDHVLFHKQEARFKLPHFLVSAKIDLPTSRPTVDELVSFLSGQTPEPADKAVSFREASWPARYTALAAFARVVVESLMEETYDATLAGVHFSLASTSEVYSKGAIGLELGGEGFDDKGSVVMNTMLGRLASLDISDQNVTIGLEAMKRRLSNRIKTMAPYLYVLCKSFEVLVPGLCTEEMILAQLERLTCDQLRKLTAPTGKKIDPEMTRGALIEALAIGNLTQKEAAADYFNPDLWDCFVPTKVDQTARENRVSSSHIDLGKARLLLRDLKTQKYLRVTSDLTPQAVAEDKRPLCFIHRMAGPNQSDPNSAVALFIQSPDGSAKWTAILNLFHNWIHTKFFDDLRTREALGYVVVCTAREQGTALTRVMLVQSAKDSNFVTERVFNFVQKYLFDGSPNMTEPNPLLTPEDFKANVEAVIANLQEQPKELKTLAQQYINEIFTKRYTFDRREQQVKFLQQLTHEEFKACLTELLRRPLLLLALDPKKIDKFNYQVGQLNNVNFVELDHPRGLQQELFITQREKLDELCP